MLFYKLTLLIIASSIYSVSCLKVDITSPSWVKLGDPTWLNCSYDIGDEELYAIKWFKDRQEFYRWTPKDVPSGQVLVLDYVNVDLSKSSEGNVYLSSTYSKTGGIYMCEVSTEAPLFSTKTKEKFISVYSLPEEQHSDIIEFRDPNIVYPNNVTLKVDMSYPSWVRLGDPTWLNCSYDIGSEGLYSIKWYKDGQEFYRWNPKSKPSSQVFMLNGVKVDLSKSYQSNVYLSSTDSSAEGDYACELTTDHFLTVRKLKKQGLRIYYLPDDEHLLKLTLKSGDMRLYGLIDFLCMSKPTKPGVNLSWTINDSPVNKHFTDLSESTRNGLSESTLRLQFHIQRHHVIRGRMKLTVYKDIT